MATRAFRHGFRASVVVVAALAAGWVAAEELRTWTDATGKFKIKAKFVKEDKGSVTLEQEGGEELEIELKKLSAADQKVIADLKKAASDNPFKSKSDDPFKPKGSSKSSPKSTPANDDEPSGGKVVKVDWNAVERLTLQAEEETWKLDAPATDVSSFKGRVKTIGLPPKSGFFEGIKGIAVNVAAKKAVVGYMVGEPKPAGTTRVVLCDLETGKASSPASAATQMSPLALADDGRTILMRREEFGFGNLDRLEIWTLKGSKVIKQLEWAPYSDLNGGERDVMWAEFLPDQRLVTASRSGRIAMWNIEEGTAEFAFETTNTCVPSLSPDRRLIAYSTGDKIGLFDIEKKESIVEKGTPSKLQWPFLAFSPSGKRLGCIAFDRALCWSVETGELITEIPANGSHFHGSIDYPHDDFLLAGNKFLLDLNNQLKLWQYDGAEQVKCAGGWTFFAVNDGSKTPALVAAQLPHPAAMDLLKKALTDPSLFVFKAGTTVKLDVGRIGDAAARDRVAKALTKRVELAGGAVGPNGTIDLVAEVTGPKQREVRYHGSGDYQVQEYITALRFVYQGQVAWQTQSSNVPGMVFLKRGENMEGHLRSIESPQYGFYDGVNLPKFLQKPVPGNNPQSGQTLGISKVFTTGIR